MNDELMNDEFETEPKYKLTGNFLWDIFIFIYAFNEHCVDNNVF